MGAIYVPEDDIRQLTYRRYGVHEASPLADHDRSGARREEGRKAGRYNNITIYGCISNLSPYVDLFTIDMTSWMYICMYVHCVAA